MVILWNICVGDLFFVNSVFNASSSSLSNCTSTFFECEYTVSILSKYVAFLSQNVTSNVIDRTKKNGNRSCLAFLFLYCFFAQYIQSIICWTKVTFFTQSVEYKYFNMMIKMPKQTRQDMRFIYHSNTSRYIYTKVIHSGTHSMPSRKEHGGCQFLCHVFVMLGGPREFRKPSFNSLDLGNYF